MRAEIKWSGNRNVRNGRMPIVDIEIHPEDEAERAVLRMAYSGKRDLLVWEDGAATLRIVMPRGKNGD